MDFDFDLRMSNAPPRELQNFDFDDFLQNGGRAINASRNVQQNAYSELRKNWQDCLDDCQHQGSFSSSRTFNQYPSPGLFVNDVGVIGLPLSDRDAKGIASVCRQAPFGKGDQTLVDESVRKTWELDASEFSCSNPQWTPYLDQLAIQAMEDLGVQVPGHTQPYKLLSYEEGAFFKAHRDTEKVPGMFGTLVVCLPSAHEGGSVRLVHGGKERMIETASKSAFDMTTLAWYSDVQHEIQPVSPGYRLVLTYNLVQPETAPKQTAAALDASHEKLEKLLRTWIEECPQTKLFEYPLEHQYTPSNLSLKSLKGQDAAKGRYLQALCANTGSYWFLAKMTKSREEKDYLLPSGKTISLDLRSIQKDNILADPDALYMNRSADSEDEGEYTGNENMPTAYRYHNTVAVLARKDYVISRFTKSDTNVTTPVVDAILKRCLRMIVPNEVGYGYGYGPKADSQDMSRKNHATVFNLVADFCHDNGMSDLVSDYLRKEMESEQLSTFKDLVDLIAKQVAKEAEHGGDNTWEKWQHSAHVPEVSNKPNILRFLHRLGTKTVGDAAARESIVTPTYQKLLPAYAEVARLSVNDLVKLDYGTGLQFNPYLPRSIELGTAANEFLDVMDQCMQLGLSMLVLLQRHNDKELNKSGADYTKALIRTAASYFHASRPQEPRDWSRPHAYRTRSCGCGPCQDVQAWLLDPTKETERFAYAEKTRKHLQYSFNHQSDFKFDTERMRTPYSLVIRKTRNGHARMLEQWLKNVADMRGRLAEMRNGFVFDLLGGDIVIVAGLNGPGSTARVAEPTPNRALMQSSPSALNSAGPRPVAGFKRKAEVIDLSEDGPELPSTRQTLARPTDHEISTSTQRGHCNTPYEQKDEDDPKNKTHPAKHLKHLPSNSTMIALLPTISGSPFFQKLPRELRNMIYHNIWRDSPRIEQRYKRTPFPTPT
ncbi:hypothetical protein FB567DRAFT_588356 [Paraphoma chrysanthemicola]|uniref:Prolyl 4-hydroxylase alpha subunit Fe(2+) 2OG dioxygenase domain-containing protein n=1 Tax=Paraphoma chrysanthemicola TaxID=798071 RepID=A0A8K0W2I5_9PLEO|nr:hypothetical protein FB567DRAFT_588356 [Paraphoma chrysanthemicola]